jgi:hypothetical protein
MTVAPSPEKFGGLNGSTQHAFQDFQKRLVDILESEPEDMRKFVIRFFSSVDQMVGTPKEKLGEEWIN